MTSLFSDLIISAPNGGGLFFVRDGDVLQLDDLDTTGLWAEGSTLFRGLQPSRLLAYGPRRLSLESLASEIDDIHDVIAYDSFLYLVGTTKNVVCKVDLQGNIVDRWQLPGEDDSCHVNCLAVWNGRLVFSSFGQFTQHRGYKGSTRGAGCVHDLLSGAPIIRGLSQPHSPTALADKLLVANSEAQELCEFRADGSLARSKNLGGYPRGICIVGSTIFVGLSSRRDEAESHKSSKVVALDVKSWSELGELSVPSAEIYSIINSSPTLFPALLELCSNNLQKLKVQQQLTSEAEDLRRSLDERGAIIIQLQKHQEHLTQELATTRTDLELASGGLWGSVARLIRRLRHRQGLVIKQRVS